MATRVPAPDESAFADLVVGLIARRVQVVRRKDVPEVGRDATGVFATYVTQDGELAAIGYADARVVNTLGGAMLDVDDATVLDANDKAMVLEDGLEGFREIANVFAACLNTDYTPHLRLADVHQVPGQLDDGVKQLWRKPRGRRAYDVRVDDEQPGNVVLYLD